MRKERHNTRNVSSTEYFSRYLVKKHPVLIHEKLKNIFGTCEPKESSLVQV